MRYLNHFSALFVGAFAVLSCTTQASENKELGEVDWLRNYDEAVSLAKEIDKPILLLFQEVPGCQGCVDYGQSTLSDPLIVDAIEEAFVPLAIHNNKGGHDKVILERFNEPAWNYQVMRFINVEGEDIIPRKDRVWTTSGTAARMIEALEAAKKPVPDYLRTVAWTEPSKELKSAAFSMFCFWDGEAKLGGIDGVIETEAGWMDGAEVVKLCYDPNKVKWADLVSEARAQGCAKRVYAPDEETLASTPKAKEEKIRVLSEESFRLARDSDQKRHLQFSKLKDLDLNLSQRTKVNAALSKGDSVLITKWLSPAQLKKL